jgi:hypothetical protein
MRAFDHLLWELERIQRCQRGHTILLSSAFHHCQFSLKNIAIIWRLRVAIAFSDSNSLCYFNLDDKLPQQHGRAKLAFSDGVPRPAAIMFGGQLPFCVGTLENDIFS